MTTEPTTLGGGRYQLAGLLGRGGMAEVRLAKDLRLGRTVAIKRLRADLASDPTFQARFRREAQSAAALNHPTIVAVFDTGEEISSDGSGLMLPYIVMEYVEGRTLRDILREGRKILPERALEIVGSVLDALDYSHRAGIIHRDIKPANVMLTPTGDVKVMDFGIARAISDTSATMTQTAAVVGTAQYLSPEQARGEQVDARSDLYSAGCLMYELLTGRPPFVGDSPVSVAYQHVREEAQAPSTIDPTISADIDAITLKALSKRVETRYQSATEMHADIDRALEGRAVQAPHVYSTVGMETEHFLPPAPRETPTSVASHRYEEPTQTKSRTGVWIAVVVVVAALIVAGLIFIPKMLASEPTPQAEVPKLANMTVAEAQAALEDVNLELGETTPKNSSTVKKGLILLQSVPAGDSVDEGSTIDVTVSAGTKQVSVPFVIGQKVDEASATLEGRDLVVTLVKDNKSTQPKGTVTSTDPPADTRVAVGTEVKVSYSTGPIEVKSVVGMTEDEATQTLESDGFRVVPVTESEPTDADAGVVTRQNPPAGEREPFGTTIVIYVSPGPTTTTTPSTETTPATDTTTPSTGATDTTGLLP